MAYESANHRWSIYVQSLVKRKEKPPENEQTVVSIQELFSFATIHTQAFDVLFSPPLETTPTGRGFLTMEPFSRFLLSI